MDKPVQKFFDPGHTTQGKPREGEYLQQEPAPQQPQPRNDRMDDIMVGLLRWVLYSAFMLVMLVPWVTGWRLATGCMLLGHVSAQLNNIINSIKQGNEKS